MGKTGEVIAVMLAVLAKCCKMSQNPEDNTSPGHDTATRVGFSSTYDLQLIKVSGEKRALERSPPVLVLKRVLSTVGQFCRGFVRLPHIIIDNLARDTSTASYAS